MPAALAEVVSDFAEMQGQDKLALLLEFAGELPPLPADLFAPDALAYDMMYGKTLTPFLAFSAARGAKYSDGLGMLVEQAAESFLHWRGVRPQTAPVIELLRNS